MASVLDRFNAARAAWSNPPKQRAHMKPLRRPSRPLLSRIRSKRLGAIHSARAMQLSLTPGSQLDIPQERSQKVASYGSVLGAFATATAVLVAVLTLNANSDA